MSGTWNHLRKVWGPTPDTLAKIQVDRVHGLPVVAAPAFFPSVSKGDECWWGNTKFEHGLPMGYYGQ
jgi:hypothetical protein